jgi:hypothetical protein
MVDDNTGLQGVGNKGAARSLVHARYLEYCKKKGRICGPRQCREKYDPLLLLIRHSQGDCRAPG